MSLSTEVHMPPSSRRGDSTTNTIIFLTLIIAGFLLTTWYVQTIKPTRYSIGSVSEDLTEINQHLTNACSSTVYRGTYRLATGEGALVTNTTHLCIATEAFGSCKLLPCSVQPLNIILVRNGLLTVEKTDEIIALRVSA